MKKYKLALPLALLAFVAAVLPAGAQLFPPECFYKGNCKIWGKPACAAGRMLIVPCDMPLDLVQQMLEMDRAGKFDSNNVRAMYEMKIYGRVLTSEERERIDRGEVLPDS